MTVDIVRINAYFQKRKAELTPGFVKFGYFYEHKEVSEHRVGFVFREEDLLAFVDRYKKDPIEGENITPENWANKFAAGFSEGTLLAFWAKHRFGEGHIIHDNYDRFEVYAKK